jgi:MFS family permease
MDGAAGGALRPSVHRAGVCVQCFQFANDQVARPPRKAMCAAAVCFGGGFLISAVGVALHQLWIIFLGYGVVGGCGLGIGYISPVKTLITWFPDRPGMATGMAIMGFGGGALIASPLSVWLIRAFSTPTHVGVAETFAVLGIVYFCFMVTP